VYKYTSKALPNTYRVEATPSPYKVIFEADEESILVQHIIHRDWFTRFKKEVLCMNDTVKRRLLCLIP
jgi:hypothetical protein